MANKLKKMIVGIGGKLGAVKAPWDVPERRAFGALVRRARETLGLSQEQLASTLHVAAPYISQIESGRRLPSDELCVEIARVLPNTLDFNLLRMEAQKLRTPQMGALFDRPDSTPTLSSDQFFQQLRMELADDRLPVRRREHLIRGWLEEIAHVKARLEDGSVHRTRREKSPAAERRVSASHAKGSR